MKVVPAAWSTNAWNDARSLMAPSYLRPLTITVGVPVTCGTFEFGMGPLRARAVAAAVHDLKVWLRMHEATSSGSRTPASTLSATRSSSLRPVVFSAGWFAKSRLWKS